MTQKSYAIAFIGYDDCLSSSIALPSEMFCAAIDAQRIESRDHSLTVNTAVKIYARKKRINCSGNIQLISNTHPRELSSPSLVILPAIWRNPKRVLRKERYLIPLLNQWNDSGVKICAVGSSSLFLAEAKLLQNRAATTHWSQIDSFAKQHPDVQLEKKFLITQSDNIYCAASVNSVADLVIHFIEEMFGNAIAKRVEANFSPEIRKSYATSLYQQGENNSRHTDEDIIRLQHWLHENFKKPIKATDMADMLGISMRSLNRRFKASIKRRPIQYLQELKVNHAKELLQHTNLSTREISTQCGFNNVSYFCSSFKNLATMPPGEYRTAVKAKLFSPPN